jgi:hypothetical protein
MSNLDFDKAFNSIREYGKDDVYVITIDKDGHRVPMVIKENWKCIMRAEIRLEVLRSEIYDKIDKWEKQQKVNDSFLFYKATRHFLFTENKPQQIAQYNMISLVKDGIETYMSFRPKRPHIDLSHKPQ